MPQTPHEMPADDVRRLLAYLAVGLVAGGVPSHEVEDDIRAVADRLGHSGAQVIAAPTSVSLTLRAGAPATVESVEGSLRLDQLAEVNALQLGLLTGRLSGPDALQRLLQLRAQPHRYSTSGLYLGGVLSAVGIALLLHPGLASVVFAAALSPVVISLVRWAARSRAMGTLLPLVTAFAVATAAFVAFDQGWIDAPLRTLLPPLAVLLPGALIVTGLSELAAGAMVAGSARLTYGATQLLLFAVGVGGAALLLNPPTSAYDTTRAASPGWWAGTLGVLLVTVGISLMESVAAALIPWVLAIIGLTFIAQTGGTHWLDSPWAGAFLGAAAASLGSAVVEFLRPQLSRVVVFLPSFWLLVPGSIGLLSLAQLGVSPTAALDTILLAAGLMLAIALGVVVGASLARSLRLAARRTGMRQLLRQVAHRRRPRSTY